ncbi:hypothetical protein DFH07DRAFT_956421 [Mycena maculata]|uniref:Uncharacterized protein n=1 Tax=Mycena maculata TaxID=230809 RepID=A0AAD7JHN5_9AGAR|nr:hypothetical protein DFH07DRAFT_956421 [Mycena maculata]
MAGEMTKEQITAHNARVASWVYNDKLRAADANRPKEEREVRRQARLEAARRYRENNRGVLAQRERRRRRHEEKAPNFKKIARDLKDARRKRLGEARLGGDQPAGDESSGLPPSPVRKIARFPESLVLTRTTQELRDIDDKIDTERSVLVIMESSDYYVNDTSYHTWSWGQTSSGEDVEHVWAVLNNWRTGERESTIPLPLDLTSQRRERILARLACSRQFAAWFMEHKPRLYSAAHTLVGFYKEYLTWAPLLATEETRLLAESRD